MRFGRAVHEILKTKPKDRKCFRMVGGVLVERNVGEVMPAVDHNRAQVGCAQALISLFSLLTKNATPTAAQDVGDVPWAADRP